MPTPPMPPPGSQPTDPGSIPLRPLRVPELIGVAWGVTRRHLALLGPLAILTALIANGAQLAIIAGAGLLNELASGQWITDLLERRTVHVPWALVGGTIVSATLSAAGAFAVAGVAAACAGADASGSRGTSHERLRGRGPAIVAAALLVGILMTVGLSIFLIPGLIIFAVWALALPALVLENASVATALHRSVRLSRGHRARIIGATISILVITYVIELVVATITNQFTGSLSQLGALLTASAVSTVVAGVTVSWVAAVIALLYLDVRVRDENLATALRTSAQRGPAAG